MADYLEIKKGRMRIIMMRFPYRKKLGLGIYDEHRNEIKKVATFGSEEAAEEFMQYLARFVGAKMEEK